MLSRINGFRRKQERRAMPAGTRVQSRKAPSLGRRLRSRLFWQWDTLILRLELSHFARPAVHEDIELQNIADRKSVV